MSLSRFFLILPLFFYAVGCAHLPPKVSLDTSSGRASYFYLLSELDIRRNRIDRALDHLNQALGEEGNQSWFFYKRADLYASLGDMQKAEIDLKRALELSPADPSYLILQGKIFQRQSRYAEAIDSYQQALKKEDPTDEAKILLVESFIGAKRFEEALRLVIRWQRKDTENVVPVFYEAWIYQNFLKNPIRERSAYRKILNLEPTNLRALSALAENYLGQKKFEKALETFLILEALAPQDPSLSLKIGLIYYDRKQYDKAIEKFQSVLKTHPEAERVIYYLGVIYENIRLDDKASHQFEKIGPTSTFFKDARLHMAYLKRRAQSGEKTDEAIAILRESIQVKPEIGSFYEYLAEIYREQNDIAKAVATLQEGLSHSSEKETLHYSLGMLYERTGQWEEGIQAMQEVLKINPQNASAMNFIGYSYAERGIHLDEALILVKKALELKPEDGFIMDSVGWAYFKKGEVDRALSYILKAYRMVPGEPTITEHLGDLYLAKKERGKGLKYLRKVLTILGETKEGKKDIERIRKKIEGIR